MRGRLGPVLALGVTSGVLALVLWASMGGPVTVTAHAPPHLDLPTPSPAQAGPTPLTSSSSGDRDSAHGISWVGELATAVLVTAICLLALWALHRLRLRNTLGRRRHGRGPSAPPPPTEPDADTIRAGLADRYADQLAALSTMSPTEGIVRAWVLFEEAAAGAGVTRASSETTTDFVARLLGLLQVDPAAVLDLRELYLEARFSTHPLGDGERDRAHLALAAIHRDIRPAVPSGDGR